MATQTSIVTGIDFVSIPTADLERALAFYEDVLGLPRSVVEGSEGNALDLHHRYAPRRRRG